MNVTELKPTPDGFDAVEDSLTRSRLIIDALRAEVAKERTTAEDRLLEIAALKAKLERYEGPLTCEQAATVYEAWDDGCYERDDRMFACVFEWDAAIRKVRGDAIEREMGKGEG